MGAQAPAPPPPLPRLFSINSTDGTAARRTATATALSLSSSDTTVRRSPSKRPRSWQLPVTHPLRAQGQRSARGVETTSHCPHVPGASPASCLRGLVAELSVTRGRGQCCVASPQVCAKQGPGPGCECRPVHFRPGSAPWRRAAAWHPGQGWSEPASMWRPPCHSAGPRRPHPPAFLRHRHPDSRTETRVPHTGLPGQPWLGGHRTGPTRRAWPPCLGRQASGRGLAGPGLLFDV